MHSRVAFRQGVVSDPRWAATSRGVTLIELIIAIGVLSILVAMAAPSFRDASLGSRLSGAANNLLASTQLARSEAIKRNAPVTLCASTNGTDCDDPPTAGWQVGWIVLTEDDAMLQRQPALPADLKVTQAAAGDLIFPATVVGVTSAPASFTVCRGSPVGKQERVVTVTVSGAASVSHTEAGVCP